MAKVVTSFFKVMILLKVVTSLLKVVTSLLKVVILLTVLTSLSCRNGHLSSRENIVKEDAGYCYARQAAQVSIT